MLTNNLGYPRIGSQRELKKACESYWSGKTGLKNVLQVGKNIRQENWQLQKEAGIDLIPSNDFSFYDQVLDHSLMFGAIPKRYNPVILKKGNSELDLYFAMARGYQQDDLDIVAMEMTKWFDTNYHYIVPEFYKDQQFKLFSTKVIDEFYEAKQAGIMTKPVLIGPVSYLLLGKEKEDGFDRIDLIRNLLPVYLEILNKLNALQVGWIQFDEPFLTMDLTLKEQEAYAYVYKKIRAEFPKLKIVLATYFEGLAEHAHLACSLPVNALHIDLVRAPGQMEKVLKKLNSNTILSLGLVDGRNIWKNDFETSLGVVDRAVSFLGTERVWIGASCSLIHSPCDLKSEDKLSSEILQWLAFAKQKIREIVLLKQLAEGGDSPYLISKLEENHKAALSKKQSALIHDRQVKDRVKHLSDEDTQRKSGFKKRQILQRAHFNLPLFPTTTIGSFPQTAEIRQLRAKLKSGVLTEEEYVQQIKDVTLEVIRWQEEIGLDVLVHGEYERNDMVEYFGELLSGYAFTKNGWVQSYGSRCVKPPIIYGDVRRVQDLSVRWTSFAQQNTSKIMKGMLTGPVTMLQWSFVRNDQPRSETAFQIALAIRDEVVALEEAGIRMIQIDEPAIREGLPLKKADWAEYLEWAVKAFRISASGVADETQIHTHMCYSEFNDIIKNIADMDADVITIETSRSEMELLDAFVDFKYPNEIGPGVYDIHSPRVPSVREMVHLLNKAASVLPKENIWVNPDCGLKTRKWAETEVALKNMVEAATVLRASVKQIA